MIQEEMRQEAIQRLDMLVEKGLWDEAKKHFEAGKPCFAECKNVFGDLTGVTYTFAECSEFNEIKDKFEEKTGCLVYYGLYNVLPEARLLTLLYVSKNKKRWAGERRDLKAGHPYTIVFDIDADYNEHGEVGIRMANGGLIRTY